MSEMALYFQSLERAADLACAVQETLQKHPNAIVHYKDDEFNQALIQELTDLEDAVSDPETAQAKALEAETLKNLFQESEGQPPGPH